MPTTTVDPWLSALQRRDAQLVQLDAALTIAVQAALTDVFADLWSAVLGMRPAIVAAAAPDLTGIEQTARRSWTNALRRWLRPLVSAAYNRQYAELRPNPDPAVADRYWGQTVARIDDSIDAVVDDLRALVRDHANLGISGLRDQVARLLQLDAVTQGFRDDIARVEAQLFNSGLSAAERARLLDRRTAAQMAVFQTQAARARSRGFSALAAIAPAEQKPELRDLARQAARSAGTEGPARAEIDSIDATLYRNPELTPEQYSTLRQRRRTLYARAHESAETWRHTAERIARTESTGVLNAATLQSGVDTQEADGVELVKRWISTRDTRTRPSHRQAEGQLQPLDAPFLVGESRLDAPGDPTGEPDEVIQCRCAMAVLTREENDEIAATLAAAGGREPVMSVTATEGTAVQTELPIGWRGIFAPIGRPTGDGRMLAMPPGGEVRFRQPPWPMAWQERIADGHDGAVVVGKASKFWVDDDQMLWGMGPFDLGSENGREAARLLHGGFLNGVSLDPDDVVVEYDAENDLAVYKDWRVMGGTFLPFAAFDEARLEPVYATDLDLTLVAAIEAAAAEPHVGTVSDIPVYQPSDFDAPKFAMPTPLTITREGRIFGHLAQWGVCHVGIANACVTAPHTATSYDRFHQGTVNLADGSSLRVGKITLGGGHADPQLGLIPASGHYDDARWAKAVVRATEDQFGIVVAGRLLSSVTREDIELLQITPLSGDWRWDGAVNNLELVAALAVNTPGFPILADGRKMPLPSPVLAMSHGRQISLLSAGVVPPRPIEERTAIEVRKAYGREKKVEQLTARVKLDPKSRAAALAARVTPDSEGA